MGREAMAEAEYDGQAGESRVLLEGEGLILRGAVKARIARDAVRDLAVEGGDLTGQGPKGGFRLALGAVEAGRWKSALEKPAPSLGDKLGLKPGVTVWVHGEGEAPELWAALAESPRAGPDAAHLRLALAETEAALAAALAASDGSCAPIWVIHGKGPKAAFGDNAARAFMRERGYVDVKASAVSDRLSATRYLKR